VCLDGRKISRNLEVEFMEPLGFPEVVKRVPVEPVESGIAVFEFNGCGQISIDAVNADVV